jgi:peptidoglycan-associated lipoprotein
VGDFPSDLLWLNHQGPYVAKNIAPKEETLQFNFHSSSSRVPSSTRLAYRRSLTLVASMAALFFAAGCHKKASPPPPPPPISNTAPAPTATITASPTSINPGDSVVLSWRTTDASDVSIEGIGSVPTAGTRTVKPTESTNFHLIARGDGGSRNERQPVRIRC